jgi:hypothetical protein
MLHLSLSEVNCLHSVWNESLLQSLNVFYASEKCLYFIKNNFLCLLRLYYVFGAGISKVLGTK